MLPLELDFLYERTVLVLMGASQFCDLPSYQTQKSSEFAFPTDDGGDGARGGDLTRCLRVRRGEAESVFLSIPLSVLKPSSR